MNALRQGALSYPCLGKKDRLAVPVYGPVLLLVLAGCNTTSHTGPKPATGASGAPFVAATIDGLKGPDTMSFAKAEARIYADLATEGAQADKAVFFRDGVSAGEGVETSAGAASGANLDAYTHLVGTGFADHLLGDEQNNIIVGEGGDDLIEGRAGEDQLYGAYGDDRLHGGGGRDSLYGGAGDDWLLGGWKADSIDGGEGSDTASYRSSNARVVVDLEAAGGLQDEAIGNAPQTSRKKPWMDSNHSYGDVLKNIENLDGSPYADKLSGDSGANRLAGLAGDDILNGRGGDDTLIGGPGTDLLTGGGGNDTLYGEAGDDTLNGDGGSNTLYGGAGNDVQTGGNDSLGEDTLWGGDGNDVFQLDYENRHTTVKDFEAGKDKIRIHEASGQSTLAGANMKLVDVGSHVELQYTTTSRVWMTIENIDDATLALMQADGNAATYFEFV